MAQQIFIAATIPARLHDGKPEIQAIAATRQPDQTVFVERVHEPHNVSAVLRSCDAVGIMHVHAVPIEGGLPKLDHTSGGAQRRVELKRHTATASSLNEPKGQGFQLHAAHFPKPRSVTGGPITPSPRSLFRARKSTGSATTAARWSTSTSPFRSWPSP
jgi:tRNA G18 (ribose-2'-O)-methylase SpoU